MDKYKKIDKEYLLTDSSVNCYSYRALTSGFDLAEFLKNPIGYYMHGTSTDHPREQGVLVRWEDIRRDGDKVFGKPCINLSHPRGQRTVDEIENGFLNGASIGAIRVFEVSERPEDYLPGQEGPTLSKWAPGEISLVDRPGNYNALTDLVDANDMPLNLADFKPQFKQMKQIFLTPAQLALIPNLSADPTQEQVNTAISDLAAKAAKTDLLQAQLTVATTAKEKAETDLKNLKAESTTTQVKDLLAQGVKDKKLTVEMSNKLAAKYADDVEGLKDLLGALTPATSIVDKITDKAKNVSDLAGKSWDELDQANKLADLKAADENLFFDKFKEKFKKAHGEDKR